MNLDKKKLSIIAVLVLFLFIIIYVLFLKPGSNKELTIQNDIEDVEVSCFTYEKDESGVVITAYDDKCPKEVGIPNVIEETTVTKIGVFAFSNKSITKLRLPKDLKEVGNNSFQNNQLENVIVPDSVTLIGSYAFENNNIKSLSIPIGLKQMGAAAFNNNDLSDDKGFIFARNEDGSVNNTKVVSYGGSKKEGVIIPEGVNTIGDWSFSKCELISITLPESTNMVGIYAFSDNKLTTIKIPKNVANLGDYAFTNNELAELNIELGLNSIGNYVFSNNKLTKINLPVSISKLNNYSFEKNTIVEVIMPENMEITESSISENFYKTYVTNKKEAGTYKSSEQNGTWTKQS